MKKLLVALWLLGINTGLMSTPNHLPSKEDLKSIHHAPSLQENGKWALVASTVLSVLGGTLEGKKCFKPVIVGTVFGGLFTAGQQFTTNHPLNMRHICGGMVLGAGFGWATSYVYTFLTQPAHKNPIKS